MPDRRKHSISRSLELDELVEAVAAADGVLVSAWLARAKESRLLVQDGLAAMAEWRSEHEDFTSEKLLAGTSPSISF